MGGPGDRGRGKGEGAIVKELDGYISSRDKAGILGILKRIKEESRVFEGFVKNGGLKVLIEVLRVQNTKILDYALSILANAYLKSWVREETKDKKLPENLLWILQNLPPGPTLHCRACRLIGNMCLSKRHSESLCALGVLPALLAVLKSPSTPQTHSMAVRAVRNIWESHKASQTEVIDSELIKEVMVLLITSSSHNSSDPTETKFKDLSETCLKALKVLLDPQDLRIAKQINSVKNFNFIVDLCASNHRSGIQLLHKLTRTAENRPELGTCGAIDFLITFLKTVDSESSLNSVTYEVITSLCLFSREAVNRAKIRDCGGLEVMIGLLEDEGKEKHHHVLLCALTQFVGDENSIRVMIKGGVVGVIVRMLNRMVLDVRLEEKGRKRGAEVVSLEGSTENKVNRTSNGRFSLDFYSSRWSPRSANSPTSSPSGSPPLPSYDCNDNDEENYSPVCSEAEDCPENEDAKSTATRDEIDSLNSFVCSSIGKDESQPVEKEEECPVMSTGMSVFHTWTLQLLARLTFWERPVEGLANPITIQALTAYIEASKNTDALPIVNRIIENYVYFMPLLLQGFVFDVQTLRNSQEYLRTFSQSAESGGAFGDLSTILRRGRDPQKFMVALSVPFLLKSRDKLRTLLTEYGGLDLIFQLLGDEGHEMNEKAIFSVCQLAEALGVRPTRPEDHSDDVLGLVGERKEVEEDGGGNQKKRRKNGGKENLVVFELDDGGTVEACRRVLCGKSEAFSAMLEGRFFEAGQTRVRLHHVSTEGLSVLCALASGKLSLTSKKPREKLEIEALLDAVLLADKFLMFDESESLTETSVSELSHRNLSRAWNWARTNGCSEFRICCVKYFLTSRASREDRLHSFKDFSSGKHFREFLEDVRGIIMKKLSIR
ncbi:armadillo repeat-containing protein 5 [Diachasma alloeum]|uniref:armadillo repeat-containing protein 5 n=1 Tax=Diachasma alloeum TaxID=454923 RepID=UPI00073828E2|nr:armadillo repeat-containing protein 5 [Diachasma alloeum]